MEDIFEKFHLTFSEKRFIKETIEVLSIFEPKVEKIIKEKLKEIERLNKDKFCKGKEFFSFIFSLRYPILSRKILSLKKYKIPQNLEFDEEGLSLKNEIKEIINEI